MKKNNLIRFVQSLVFLPVMTASLTGISNTSISQSVLAQKVNIQVVQTLAINQALSLEATKQAELDANILDAKAEAIDAYFANHDMPLEGTGKKMAEEADANDLDWRLMPAIAVRESTGGKHDCKRVDNNPFGWGSCKIGFDSLDKAIETVALNLGGNNPKTAKHYGDKTTKQILRAYNPPSVVPRYAQQVMTIMDEIGLEDITGTLNS